MTDAEFECWTNTEFLRKATGDVLIAGLGIGFIVVPLLKQRSVKSITVLEVNPDVIQLVGPEVESKKVKIIQADARAWKPGKNSFDVIYFDIWPDVPNEDHQPDISALKRRYKGGLRDGGWMAAWCEDITKGCS